LAPASGEDLWFLPQAAVVWRLASLVTCPDASFACFAFHHAWRYSAATLLTEQVEKLMYELSMWRATPELKARSCLKALLV
jgi:hypothetical protein